MPNKIVNNLRQAFLDCLKRGAMACITGHGMRRDITGR